MQIVHRETGASLIFVVILILVLGMIIAAMISLVNTESFTAMNGTLSAQAMFVAQGGAENSIYDFKTATNCDPANNATNTALGAGRFDTVWNPYNPTPPQTLTANMVAADTIIPIGNLANYAPHGRVQIDSELIEYTGTSATTCPGFPTPCLTGAQRGMAGTTQANHSGTAPTAAYVYQTECLIRVTGKVNSPLSATATAQRVVETGVANAPLSAYLDGFSTVVSTFPAMATIGSLSTFWSAGTTNLVIAIVSFRNTAPSTNILNGNLQLRRTSPLPVATLTQNPYTIRVGQGAGGANPGDNDFFNETQLLVFRDVGAPANAVYDVIAGGSNANTSAEVKMIVLGPVPNLVSAYGTGNNGNATLGSGFDDPILTFATGLPAGENVIIAAVHLDNVDNGARRSINAGNLKLKRGAGGATLASNQFAINLARSGRVNHGTGFLLIARDPAGGGNQTYEVTGNASNNNSINADVKMLVINGLTSASQDTGSVTLGNIETVVANLNTAFAAGENVVIAATQYENSAGGAGTPRNIAVGSERIITGGTIQTSNPLAMTFCAGTTECNDLAAGLLWRHPSAGVNPAYDVRALADVTNSIRAEAKIVAIRLGRVGGGSIVDRKEVFP